MQALSSSVRITSAKNTIEKAKKISTELGITRVTDITKLDFLDMPVFASIRPVGKVLCVHNGKGVFPEEAKAGAYMEAIEFACADPENSILNWFSTSYQEVQDNLPDNLELTDFCFRINRECDLSKNVFCVRADELISNESVILPEELFYLPSVTPRKDIVFGFSTNGLASGNSILEASIHAICEIVERDTMSFDKVSDKSYFINENDLPEELKSLMIKIKESGLDVCLRYLENEFDIPVFKAYIFEKNSDNYCSAAHGCGAHPIKSIAAARAITEAIQSRLTAIHGGRDDLIDQYKKYSNLKNDERAFYYDSLKKVHFSEIKNLDYQNIICAKSTIFSLEDIWSFLLNSLKNRGFNQIFRVVHFENEDIAVIKIVIPRMEHFETYAKRIGPRLWKEIQLIKM